MQSEDQHRFSLLRGLGPQPTSGKEAAAGGVLAGVLVFVLCLLVMPVAYALLAGVVIGAGVVVTGCRKVRNRRRW